MAKTQRKKQEKVKIKRINKSVVFKIDEKQKNI